MTIDACKKIFDGIPDSAIVHMKTKNGDKICIKDNGKSEDNKISTTMHDGYLEISSKNASDKKITLNNIYIAYEDIVQFEMQTTSKI